MFSQLIIHRQLRKMNNLTNNQRRESVGVIEEFKYLNDLTASVGWVERERNPPFL